MTRRRGDTEDPHPDYLDTARDQDPRYEETRPLRDASKRTQETGRTNTHHNDRSS